MSTDPDEPAFGPAVSRTATHLARSDPATLRSGDPMHRQRCADPFTGPDWQARPRERLVRSACAAGAPPDAGCGDVGATASHVGRRCGDPPHRCLGAGHRPARAHSARGRAHRGAPAARPDRGRQSRRRPCHRPAHQRSRRQGRRLHLGPGVGASSRTSRPAARRSRPCAPSPPRSTCWASKCCPRSSPPPGELDPSTLRGGDGAIDLAAHLSGGADARPRRHRHDDRATAAVAARPAIDLARRRSTRRGATCSRRCARWAGRLHSADPGLADRAADARAWTAPSATSSPSRTTPRRAAPAACPAPSRSSAPRTARSVRALRERQRAGRCGAERPRLRTRPTTGCGREVRPSSEYVDSNVSAALPVRRPHLAGHVAAQDRTSSWTARWRVDPQALAYLLAVTGPATLPDRSTVSASNVVQLTQQTLYRAVPGRRGWPRAQEATCSTLRGRSAPR